jgi:hypothetical protein
VARIAIFVVGSIVGLYVLIQLFPGGEPEAVVVSCPWPRAPRPQKPSTASRRSTVIVSLCNDDFSPIVADLVRLVRCIGAYDGPIVVLYSGTRALSEPVFAAFNVTMQEVTALFPADLRAVPQPPCAKAGDYTRKKRIDRWSSYYAKTAIFSSYFKQWDTVLWLDARTAVHRPLSPFFDEIDVKGKLIASPDNWPGFEDTWKLSNQFFAECDTKLYAHLSARYDMSRDYFQSTVMLFDTAIVGAESFRDIALLFREFSRIGGSDQPFFSIYWDQIRRVYEPFPYRLKSLQTPYDFFPRIREARYITSAWRKGT